MKTVTQRVIALRQEGLTQAAIATRLRTTVGTVAGVIRRHRLSPPEPKPRVRRPARVPSARKTPARPPNDAKKEKTMITSPPLSRPDNGQRHEPTLVTTPLLPGDGGKTLFDLGPGDCRWSTGRDEEEYITMFCGAPALPLRPYVRNALRNGGSARASSLPAHRQISAGEGNTVSALIQEGDRDAGLAARLPPPARRQPSCLIRRLHRAQCAPPMCRKSVRTARESFATGRESATTSSCMNMACLLGGTLTSKWIT